MTVLLLLAAAALFALLAAYIAGGVLADKAAESQWRQVDAAWALSGRDQMAALSAEVHRRAAAMGL